MNFSELLEWQWKDYSDRHRNRTNLLIHAVSVPAFIVGTVNLAFAIVALVLFEFEFSRAMGGLLLMIVALFAESTGNALETSPPEPFKDRMDFARRVVAEHFVTFPRFVLTGGWLRNFQESAPPAQAAPPQDPPQDH